MSLDFSFVLKSSNKLKAFKFTAIYCDICYTGDTLGSIDVSVNKNSTNCFEFTDIWYFIVPQNTDWPAAFLDNNWWLCSHLTFALELESVK